MHSNSSINSCDAMFVEQFGQHKKKEHFKCSILCLRQAYHSKRNTIDTSTNPQLHERRKRKFSNGWSNESIDESNGHDKKNTQPKALGRKMMKRMLLRVYSWRHGGIGQLVFGPGQLTSPLSASGTCIDLHRCRMIRHAL